MRMKTSAAVLCFLAMATATLAFWDKSPEKKRDEIRQMKNATLAELYKLRPEAANLIKGAEGFAVFSTKGMKIMVAGTTSGKGVLVDQKTGQKTYMKMAQVNVGLGFGLQDARLVFVFQDRKAMEEFTTQGWDFSGKGDASVAAKGQGQGAAGALSFMPGVLVYQFTQNGLAASLTLQGTKFWADKDLNS